jgi:hypothetical protein
MSVSSKLQHLFLKDISSCKFTSNTHAFAADQCARSLTKKFCEGSGDNQRRERAISLFLDINANLREFNPVISRDEVAMAIEYGRQTFLRLFPQNTWYEPRPENGQFGPGASMGVPYNDFYSKYVDTLTYSSTIAREFFCADPNQYYSIAHKYATSAKFERVATSKFWTVPKNNVIDRCINIEPSLNMFLQKAIEADLVVACRRLGIDIQTQSEVQKNLARRGSTDDSLSTVDLSSASDTISISFCKHYLPVDLFQWLMAARSSKTTLPDGREIELKMIGTMGNATTFPLETLIFLTLCMGVYQVLNIKPSTRRTAASPRNLGVFGDDIIVVRPAYDLLVQVLDTCGFTVNLEKSFKTGLFKESCGGDYYNGTDVRGVYIKSLRNAADLYSAINRLTAWSRTFKVPLPNTLNWLICRLRKPLRVPPYMPVTSGIWDDNVRGRFKYLAAKPVVRKVVDYDPDFVYYLICSGHILRSNDSRITVPLRGVQWKVKKSYRFYDKPPKETLLTRYSKREYSACSTSRLEMINRVFGLATPVSSANWRWSWQS